MARSTWLMAASALALLALPTRVFAESFVPPDTPRDANSCAFLSLDVTPMAGEIPANLPYIELSPYSIGEDIAMTTELVRRDTSERVPFTVDLDRVRGRLRLVLGAELVAGQVYDLIDPVCLERMRRTTTYTVSAPLPEVTSLGVLEARRIRAVYPALGQPRQTLVDTRLTPDASMVPWFAYYFWGIDGPGVSPLIGFPLSADASSLEPSIQVQCTGPDTVVGPFVGTAYRYASADELSTAPTRTLRCGDADVFNAAGELLAPSAIAIYEAALLDGGVGNPDAAQPDGGIGNPDAAQLDGGIGNPDAGSASLDGGRNTEPDTNPNCSCHVTSAHTTAQGWLAGLGVVALVLARRRRRSLLT